MTICDNTKSLKKSIEKLESVELEKASMTLKVCKVSSDPRYDPDVQDMLKELNVKMTRIKKDESVKRCDVYKFTGSSQSLRIVKKVLIQASGEYH